MNGKIKLHQIKIDNGVQHYVEEFHYDLQGVA
jgi:hypothetical protein